MIFRRRKLRVADPETRSRVLSLLREAGPLFLEAAFRHTGSDYYILSSQEEVQRVLDHFSRPGGETPLEVTPLSTLLEGAQPLASRTASPVPSPEEVALALNHSECIVRVRGGDSADRYYLVADQDEWAELVSSLGRGARATVYDAFAAASQRCSLTVWAP